MAELTSWAQWSNSAYITYEHRVFPVVGKSSVSEEEVCKFKTFQEFLLFWSCEALDFSIPEGCEGGVIKYIHSGAWHIFELQEGQAVWAEWESGAQVKIGWPRSYCMAKGLISLLTLMPLTLFINPVNDLGKMLWSREWIQCEAWIHKERWAIKIMGDKANNSAFNVKLSREREK